MGAREGVLPAALLGCQSILLHDVNLITNQESGMLTQQKNHLTLNYKMHSYVNRAIICELRNLIECFHKDQNFSSTSFSQVEIH